MVFRSGEQKHWELEWQAYYAECLQCMMGNAVRLSSMQHSKLRWGLGFRVGVSLWEPELVGWKGVMGANLVPQITNLARRGWRCPHPWQTCWSQCKRRRLHPRAGHSELSGCH